MSLSKCRTERASISSTDKIRDSNVLNAMSAEGDEQTAGQTALNTYDILENILPLLDAKQILNCRTVNKVFRYTIDTSATIRKRLCIKIAPWKEVLEDENTQGGGGGYLWAHHPFDLHNLGLRPHAIWYEDDAHLTIEYQLYAYRHFDDTRANAADWRDRISTMPKFCRALYFGTAETTHVQLEGVQRNDTRTGWWGITKSLEASKGITLGEVVDAVQEWLDEPNPPTRAIKAVARVDCKGRNVDVTVSRPDSASGNWRSQILLGRAQLAANPSLRL